MEPGRQQGQLTEGDTHGVPAEVRSCTAHRVPYRFTRIPYRSLKADSARVKRTDGPRAAALTW